MAEATEVHTLSPTQLAAVAKTAGRHLGVTSTTTPLEAGFKLGVQHVLNILSEGFTVAVQTPARD